MYEFDHPPVHDACCVAALIDPAVFTTAKADVRVELRGEWTRGATVVNFENVPGMHHTGGSARQQREFRMNVALQLDQERFADLIVDAVERLTAGLAPASR